MAGYTAPKSPMGEALSRPQKKPNSAMVERVKARILAGKKASSAPAPKASSPKAPAAAPAAVVDPNTQRATADVNLSFGPKEQKLIDLIGQGTQHQSTIDRVYAGYQKAQAAAQAQHDVVQGNILASMQGGAATAFGGAVQGAQDLNAGAQAQNAVTGADTGQNAVVQQRIAQAIAGNVGAAKSEQNTAQLIGAADNGALQRLGLIAEGQRGLYHENTQAYVNSLGKDQATLAGEKGQAIIAQKGKYDDADAAAAQQKITNLLAQQSLASKDKATQARFDAAIQAIQGRLDVAGVQATTAGAHDTSAEGIAAANRKNAAEIAKANRQTQKEVAAMRAAGTPASATVTYQDLGTGQTVVLSGDKRQAWTKAYANYRAGVTKATKLVAAHAGDKTTSEQRFKDLAAKLASTSGLPLPVARAALYNAQHPGKLSGEYAQILRSYFPGGLVPGPLISGGGFKRA